MLTTNKSSRLDTISGFLIPTAIKFPIPRIVQGQVGQDSEQHDLVEDIPPHYSKDGSDHL